MGKPIHVFASDTSFNCFSAFTQPHQQSAFTHGSNTQKKSGKTVKAEAVVSLVVAAGVILSTLFIKQHYIADEIAGIALAWIIGALIFKKLWKKQASPKPI